MPGVIDDRYKVEDRVKQGGTAIVYTALDMADGNREVALKVLTPDAMASRVTRASLAHEATVAMRFEHPHVIQIYRHVRSKPADYTVMEYFPSRDLKSLVMNEHKSVQRRCQEIILKTAEALKHIHSRGVVHCDLKPTNILLSDSWDLKLIDFSIAETRLKRLIPIRLKSQGTPEYMAPEQFEKGRITPRTDIYALGGTIYWILTGRTVFVAGNMQGLRHRHLNVAPEGLQVHAKCISLPFNEYVTERLLAKDPADRPRDMNEVITALRTLKIFTT